MSESDENRGFGKNFSDAGFWNKVVQFAKVAGREVIEKALWLYYAAQKPDTPKWAKAVIFGALGYFIFPIDAIPDVTPIVGYVDDLGVLVAAVASVAVYIDQEVKDLTEKKLTDWFGE